MDLVLGIIIFAGILHLPILADLAHHLCPNTGVARLTSAVFKPVSPACDRDRLR